MILNDGDYLVGAQKAILRGHWTWNLNVKDSYIMVWVEWGWGKNKHKGELGQTYWERSKLRGTKGQRNTHRVVTV